VTEVAEADPPFCVAYVIVVQVSQDDEGQPCAVDPQGRKPVRRTPQVRPLPLLGHLRGETRVDDDRVLDGDGSPNEVVHGHRTVMRVPAVEVLRAARLAYFTAYTWYRGRFSSSEYPGNPPGSRRRCVTAPTRGYPPPGPDRASVVGSIPSAPNPLAGGKRRAEGRISGARNDHILSLLHETPPKYPRSIHKGTSRRRRRTVGGGCAGDATVGCSWGPTRIARPAGVD
jgi:hypothetical protein